MQADREAIMLSFQKLPGAKDTRNRRGHHRCDDAEGTKRETRTTVPIERTESRFGRDGAAGQL